MEFGRLTPEEFNLIDYTLPQDTALTLQALSDGNTSLPFDVRVGTHTWGRKDWCGVIYPPKTPDREFLTHYSKQFNSIELNATYYNIYPEEMLAKWYDKTSAETDFKFYSKLPQSISHIRRLKNAKEQTQRYYDGLKGFREKLDGLLLQLPENFTPKSYPELEEYVLELPKTYPIFVEARNKAWFSESENTHKLFSLLYGNNLGSVITDAPGRRDCVHMTLTTPYLFVRFVSANENIDKVRLDAWIDRIVKWRTLGLLGVRFFMHTNPEIATPNAVDYFIEQLNSKLSLNLKRPKFIDKQF
jgi:uncharacterized protein YecE (DUF72 family)